MTKAPAMQGLSLVEKKEGQGVFCFLERRPNAAIFKKETP
jgi:hypothetical protein